MIWILFHQYHAANIPINICIASLLLCITPGSILTNQSSASSDDHQKYQNITTVKNLQDLRDPCTYTRCHLSSSILSSLRKRSWASWRQVVLGYSWTGLLLHQHGGKTNIDSYYSLEYKQQISSNCIIGNWLWSKCIKQGVLFTCSCWLVSFGK